MCEIVAGPFRDIPQIVCLAGMAGDPGHTWNATCNVDLGKTLVQRAACHSCFAPPAGHPTSAAPAPSAHPVRSL